MSDKGLAQFLGQLAEDESLQNDLRTIAVGTGDDTAVAAEDLVSFGAERGFEFTVSDVSRSFELGDAELDDVAGGLTSPKLGSSRSSQGWCDLGGFKSLGWSDLVSFNKIIGGGLR